MAEREKSMMINAPIDQVYNLWTNIQNFPKLLNHIKDVSVKSPSQSHWKVELAGVPMEFDAQITDMQENKRLAWKSISGVNNSGFINFEEMPQGTRITVHFNYAPETLPEQFTGQLGAGQQAEKDIEEDLNNLKSNLEKGITMAA
ncbi:MAG TPA: SRPBCC family protein [Anaerolineae bacterium]|nr:SRPBCC family protein [Anaerolineae bacterium]